MESDWAANRDIDFAITESSKNWKNILCTNWKSESFPQAKDDVITGFGSIIMISPAC